MSWLSGHPQTQPPLRTQSPRLPGFSWTCLRRLLLQAPRPPHHIGHGLRHHFTRTDQLITNTTQWGNLKQAADSGQGHRRFRRDLLPTMGPRPGRPRTGLAPLVTTWAISSLRWGRDRADHGQRVDDGSVIERVDAAMGPRPGRPRTVEPPAPPPRVDEYLRWGRGRTDRGQNLAVAMDSAGNVLRWGRGRAGRGQAEDPQADQVPDLPAVGPRPDWPRTVEHANELRIPVPILRWGRDGSGHGQISLRQQQHQVLLTSMVPQPSRPRAERAPRHDGKPDGPAMGPRPGRPRTSASLSTIGPATMWSRWSHGVVGRGQRRCSRLRHRCRTSCEGAAAVRPRTDHSRLAIHVLPTPLRWGRSRASRGQMPVQVA